MNNFIYETPTKVYFGKDEELGVGKIISEFHPKKVLIHYGGKSAKASGLLSRIENALSAEGINYIELGGVVANPELLLVREGIKLCLKEGVDFILAVGGGSVMDSSKDIANGAANPDIDVWDFSLKKSVPQKTLHKGCVLTLSAAGSEMSDSCVITNPETKEKRGYSCRANRMDFAIENPCLTYSVSKYQTACGAVDIAMHTIERYFCPGNDTYLTDGICEAVIKSAIKSGIDCINDPENYEARANMMWTSSLAHNGLTHCGREFALPVHQFEHEISGLYPKVAHGAGLAAMWCSWARYVYKSNLQRWARYAHNIWNVDMDYEHVENTILEGINRQEEYYNKIGMPTNLSQLGVKKEDIETLCLGCSRNKTRKIPGDMPLGYDEIYDIYMMALENDRFGSDLKFERFAFDLL